MTEGRNLPWLQDVDANSNQVSDVWREQWDVVYRDVIIVDSDMTELGAFNLTTFNLADAPTYAALRDILIDVAADQPFWQNPDNPLDVNKDGIVSAQGDVLPCVNELNNRFLTTNDARLPALRLPPIADAPHIDVNGDGLMTAQADVLPIINFINNHVAGEGEHSSAVVERLHSEVATFTAEVALPADLPADAWLTIDTTSPSVLSSVIAHRDDHSIAEQSPPLSAIDFHAKATSDIGDEARETGQKRTNTDAFYVDLDDLDELAGQLAVDVANAWSRT